MGHYTNEGGFDFHSLMGALQRRWKVMLLIFLAALGIQYLRLRTSEPVYQAIATVAIERMSTSPGSSVPGLEQILAAGRAREVQTHVNLLTGPMIRKRAMENLEPAQRDALREFGPVTVQQEENSSLLYIVARSHNPQAAQALATAIGREYENYSLITAQSSSRGAVTYIEKQLADVRNRLIEAQTRVNLFKKGSGVFDIASTAAAQQGAVVATRDALRASETERNALQAQLASLQQQLAGESERVVASGVTRNPLLSQLQAQLADLQAQRRDLLRDYTESSERVQALDAQIARLQERIAAQPRTIVEGWRPNPVRDALESRIAETRTNIQALGARIASLRSQLQTNEEQASTLPDKEFQFAQLTLDAEGLKQTYQLLNEQLQTLRIGEQAAVADATLSEPAGAAAKVAPDAQRMMLTAFILGLLGALAVAVIWEALDNRIYSEDDAKKATHLPVLAQIPNEKRPEHQILLNSGNKVTPMLESFRMLRANIAFSAADRPIRAIVVTSSMPNEGKSSSALNLATAAALGGENTVLIDLDLRRPSQHLLVGVPPAPGFTNVVSGQAQLEDVYQETAVPNLRLLTSGPVPPNPFKLLNSQSARQIIEEVVASADFVVIDTPPILGLADARLISTLVDATLLVVSSQETGRREAARSAELLATTTPDTLGVVLTKVPGGMGGYGYGSYYTYRSYARYFEDEHRQVEMLNEDEMLAGPTASVSSEAPSLASGSDDSTSDSATTRTS